MNGVESKYFKTAVRMDEALIECLEKKNMEYINDKCFRKYSSELADVKKRLESGNLEDLIFISPEYLRPYFEFVRENKRIYKVVLMNQELFYLGGLTSVIREWVAKDCEEGIEQIMEICMRCILPDGGKGRPQIEQTGGQ